MNKKTIFIFIVTAILVLVRNNSFEKNEFVPSPTKIDTLATKAVRIIENKPVILYSKNDTSSETIAQLNPGDTVVVLAVTEDWCRVSAKRLEGNSPAKILKSYSSLTDTPKWKIWLKHNYKGDKWQFWVLNIILIVILIGLRPVFLAFDQTVLKIKEYSVSIQSSNKVCQFFLDLLVPDFKPFYKNCIVSGALIIGVAIFYNDAYLLMLEYKLPYLISESHISGMALFAILTFIIVSLFFEITGSFLYYGYLFGSIRSIGLLISTPIIIVLTIALFMPVLMVLTALFLLKAFAKVNPVSSTSKPSSSSEETHLQVCPACGGSGKTGTGLFGGCSMCCGQGRLKYNTKGEMKGRVW